MNEIKRFPGFRRILTVGGILLLTLVVSTPLQAENAYVVTEAFIEKDFVGARAEALKIVKNKGHFEYKEGLGLYGWTEFMLDNYLAAQAAFKKLVEIKPNDFDGNLGVAWTSIKLGKLDGVESYLGKAKAAAMGWQEFMVTDARGWLAAKRGDTVKAAKIFESVWSDYVDEQEEEDDPMVGLAWLKMNKKDLDGAKDYFGEGLDRKVDCFFCRGGLARIALAKGDLETALEHAVEGNKIVNYNNGLIVLLGTVLQRIKDPQKTLDAYAALADEHDESPVFKALLGFGQIAVGKMDEAKVSFEAALKMQPNNPTALAGLYQLRLRKAVIVKDAWASYYKGKYKDALAAFEAKRGEAKANGTSAAEEGRGWTLIILGKPKQALKAFRAALEIDAGSVNARTGLVASERASLGSYNRAWRFLNSRDFAAAAKAFAEARNDATKSAQWLIDDGLAWVDYYRGDRAKAEQQFRAILEKNPNAYLSAKGMGFVLLDRNDHEGAHKYLTASFTANPFQVLASYTMAAKRMLDGKQYSQAMSLLKMGQYTYPYSADIQFQMAKAFKGLKDPASAAKKAVIAAGLSPVYISPGFESLGIGGNDVREAYRAMANGLYAAGYLKAAKVRYDQYFEAGGSDAGAKLGSAWTHLKLDQTGAAAALFGEVQTSGHKIYSPFAETGLAHVDIDRKNIDGGASRLIASFKKAPRQMLSTYVFSGSKLARAKRQADVIELMKLAETLYPLSADIQALYARAYAALNDRKKAAFHLVAAARLAPTYMNFSFDSLGLKPSEIRDAYLFMGWGNYFAKNNKGAVYRFDEYVKAGGKDLNAIRGRGFAQFRLGAFDKAVKDLAAAAAKEPKTLFPVSEVIELPGLKQSWTVVYNARSTLGWIAYRNDNSKKAVQEFSKVLKTYPGLVDSNTGMGYALLALGRKVEAARHFKAALDVSPYYPDALRGMKISGG